MAAFNWSTKYWGPDAHEFRYAWQLLFFKRTRGYLPDSYRPERWANPPEESSVIPHVYANLISFFAGPRACIGWKFALAECVSAPRDFIQGSNEALPLRCNLGRIKAILFVLLRAFDFEIDPQINVKTKSMYVVSQRRHVMGHSKTNNLTCHSIATRPMVVGQETLGTRLPLIVKARGLRVE